MATYYVIKCPACEVWHMRQKYEGSKFENASFHCRKESCKEKTKIYTKDILNIEMKGPMHPYKASKLTGELNKKRNKKIFI